MSSMIGDPLRWNLDRVVVVGTSCSGKTTLARRLAGILGTPHVELDSLHWGPEWTPHADFPSRVLEAVEQPRWVIEGNYFLTCPTVVDKSNVEQVAKLVKAGYR